MKREVRQKLRLEQRRWQQRQRSSLRQKARRRTFGRTKARYQLATRVQATGQGGLPVCLQTAEQVGLPRKIDEAVSVLKCHRPYHESDHVLAIAMNILCGGRTLDDMEHRRTDMPLMDALGVKMLPDPTTAGDFCRRFSPDHVSSLMGAINDARVEVWRRSGLARRIRTARFDADGTFVPTTGECKEGMDVAYNGVWGYHPLLVSFAPTQEPLFIMNRSGNRPSSEGAAGYFDEAVALARRAGFEDILLRGDTDFALTRNFDAWTDEGVRFVFGMDARKVLKEWVGAAPEEGFRELERRAEDAYQARKERKRPENIKAAIIKRRGFRNIRLESEDVVEFPYKPGPCDREYRIVAVRKNLSIEQGEQPLVPDIRYFFYVTNDHTLTMDQVVKEACDRCHQENLIEQLKNGARALRAPVNTLNANWAYMVMASLAWSLKAWTALLLPVASRWRLQHEKERDRMLRMDFRTFLQSFIQIPAQVIRSGRRTVVKLLAWRPWLHTLLRAAGTG